jgi:hypothetical protein
MHTVCVNGILLSDESGRSLLLRKAAGLPKHSGPTVSLSEMAGGTLPGGCQVYLFVISGPAARWAKIGAEKYQNFIGLKDVPASMANCVAHAIDAGH